LERSFKLTRNFFPYVRGLDLGGVEMVRGSDISSMPTHRSNVKSVACHFNNHALLRQQRVNRDLPVWAKPLDRNLDSGV